MFLFSKKIYLPFFLVIFIIFLAFVLFQYRAYLRGPYISDKSFSPYLNLSSAEYNLYLPVKNVDSAKLNGRNIFIRREKKDGENNQFIREKVIFSKPFDTRSLLLKDIFGHERTYTIQAWVDEKSS